jgi:hypothetical protein
MATTVASGNVGTFDNIKCLFDVHVILYRVIVGLATSYQLLNITTLKNIILGQKIIALV